VAIVILAITAILIAYITFKTPARDSRRKLLSLSDFALAITPFKA
jgi:hypothetical protein